MRLLFLIVISLNLFTANASHIVGGDIYYDYLGNDNYRFYISLYRDCLSNGAEYDNPLALSVYDGNNNLFANIDVPLPAVNNVPVQFNNPCVTPPTNICVTSAVYTTIINLPASTGGYNVTYQRCCRGPNVINLINPADVGISLTCHVPGVPNHVNSSPRFTNYPPLLLCNNQDLIFDHSATDPDGDQLVYSLVTPDQGGGDQAVPADCFTCVAPSPAPPPPYFDVPWSGGFNAANPLGPGANINIDPATGLLTASPNLLGLFVVGIQVQEIRNGVVINQTVRDFLFRVFNCQVQLESILPIQEDLPDFVSYCQGLTVNFVNNSYGGTNYAWDFGVAGTNTDVSNSFEPTFTYPTSGEYEAMLVVNPGWPCTDTAYMDIIVNNEMLVNFTSNDSMCIFDNSFDFAGSASTPAGTTFEWDFGPNANQNGSTSQNVNDVVFSSTGFIPVTLNAEFNVCNASYTDSIYIFPEPVAEIVLPPNYECDGLTVDFGNNSQEAIFYNWDFGVTTSNTDVSNIEEPTFTFPTPGVYEVNLIVGSTPACTDTTTETITINDPIILAFTSEDSLCFTNNSFSFDGTVSGPPNTVYSWDFGPNASIPTSTNIDEPAISFNTTGTIPITLTGTHENCVENLTQSIYIFQEPSIDFDIAPGLQCAPFNAQFIDQSFAETSIQYFWDFGDGNTSTLQNPSNLYTQVGNYSVNLTITTTSGCIATLNLMQQDLVNVRPNPTAGFSTDPEITDACHSLVNFNDESSGALTYQYIFDDLENESTEQFPAYIYITSGTHYPVQIVTNEYGCKDTVRNQVIIEPYTIYAPNTFTPDGNMFNNTFLPIAYLGAENWHLTIYNRWGETLFESYDINEGWDGTSLNGRKSQDGTYIWKLEYNSCEPRNPDTIITGHITLIR